MRNQGKDINPQQKITGGWAFWSALLSPAWGITISSNYRRLVSRPHSCQQDTEKATVPSFASESFNKDILYCEWCDNKPRKRQKGMQYGGEEESAPVIFFSLQCIWESAGWFHTAGIRKWWAATKWEREDVRISYNLLLSIPFILCRVEKCNCRVWKRNLNKSVEHVHEQRHTQTISSCFQGFASLKHNVKPQETLVTGWTWKRKVALIVRPLTDRATLEVNLL